MKLKELRERGGGGSINLQELSEGKREGNGETTI